MKKIFLLAGTVLMMVSCAKHGEQIDASKSKLKEIGVANPDDLEYTASEVSALDVYKKIVTSYQKKADDLKDVGDHAASGRQLDKAAEYLNLAEQNKDKKYFIVNAHQLAAGDTLHKIILYIDDTNKVIEFENLK